LKKVDLHLRCAILKMIQSLTTEEPQCAWETRLAEQVDMFFWFARQQQAVNRAKNILQEVFLKSEAAWL
jgi:hypothetical protein